MILPINLKRNILNELGITARSYQYSSSTLLNKYSTIFFDHDYSFFQKLVWNEEPDPLNPDPGWNSRKSTLIFPLEGENVKIVPENSIGYKMDSTADAATWENNAYSFTDISPLFRDKNRISQNGFFYASVFCFVSKDFDGAYARISAEGEASGKIVQEYDLSKKGIWQKLQIDFKANSGIPPVYLFWSKNGVKNFTNLRGYVIFAYPVYTTDSIFKINYIRNLRKNTKSFFITQSSFFDTKIFSLILTRIGFPILQDSVTRVKNEKFLNDLESNSFSGSRTSRWYYTWILFKDYPIHKKIFGGGFDYHEMFGKEFGEGKYDYPHNPFLSAFLYSGILGGIAYIWFMFLVFYYYVKYYRYHLYYFICFLVVFYFSFFSANTHFSVPIFAILSIIPFLTRYIVEKEKKEESADEF